MQTHLPKVYKQNNHSRDKLSHYQIKLENRSMISFLPYQPIPTTGNAPNALARRKRTGWKLQKTVYSPTRKTGGLAPRIPGSADGVRSGSPAAIAPRFPSCR